MYSNTESRTSDALWLPSNVSNSVFRVLKKLSARALFRQFPFSSHALPDRGLAISMTGETHCYENTRAERLNGILKQEYGLGCSFPGKKQALAAIDEAVFLYNTGRPHPSLNYETPEKMHRRVAYFLVQSVPAYSPTKIVTTIKSIIAREIFARHPEVKKKQWGGEFWTDGHFISRVSKHGNEYVIANYVKSQGTEEQYKQLRKITEESQPSLFD
jgi:hypothetical protein